MRGGSAAPFRKPSRPKAGGGLAATSLHPPKHGSAQSDPRGRLGHLGAPAPLSLVSPGRQGRGRQEGRSRHPAPPPTSPLSVESGKPQGHRANKWQTLNSKPAPDSPAPLSLSLCGPRPSSPGLATRRDGVWGPAQLPAPYRTTDYLRAQQGPDCRPPCPLTPQCSAALFLLLPSPARFHRQGQHFRDISLVS